MTQVRPASTGLVSSSRSLPYRHIPASRRRLSRAPRPVSWTGDFPSSSATSTVWDGGDRNLACARNKCRCMRVGEEEPRTSNPSSLVYPPRATCRLNLSIGMNADLLNVSCVRSKDVRDCRYDAALGPKNELHKRGAKCEWCARAL